MIASTCIATGAMRGRTRCTTPCGGSFSTSAAGPCAARPHRVDPSSETCPNVPWMILLILLGVLVIGAMIATAIAKTGRKTPRTGLGLRLTEPRPDGTRGLIGGSWNVMIYGESVFG